MLAKNQYSHKKQGSLFCSNILEEKSKSNSNNPENDLPNDQNLVIRCKSRVSMNSLKSFKEDVDLKSNTE